MFARFARQTGSAFPVGETPLEPDPVQHASCVVDTDVAIDFLRQRSYARQLLERWGQEGLLSMSTISHVEIYQGMRPGEEENTNAFLDGLLALKVDVAVARRAGTLLGTLRRLGKMVGIADAIVAATALEWDVPLLTNNIEHYPFPELRVFRGLET